MLNNVSLALIDTRSCNWYVEFNISAILNSAKRFDSVIIKYINLLSFFMQQKILHCRKKETIAMKMSLHCIVDSYKQISSSTVLVLCYYAEQSINMGRTAGQCIVLVNKGRLSIQQLGSGFILSQTMLLALAGQNKIPCTLNISPAFGGMANGVWKKYQTFFPGNQEEIS